MTNYEKWKSELTQRDFIHAYLHAIECDICPALESCQIMLAGNSCETEFLKWASEEVLGDGS
jgi:hypothetical protein